MSIKFSRVAALLALFGILLLNAPHVDACQNNEASCRRVAAEAVECAAPSTDRPMDSDDSDSTTDHVSCCGVHHIMAFASFGVSHPLTPVGKLELAEYTLNPLFAVNFERPPKLS
ncbi:MAG: hypothetical protein M5R36_08365 [Deltaproteobacteria bacterium]|nr:hypothetical protein [Deltaproteobacteria bacterium]